MTRLHHVPGTRSDPIVWALEEIGEPRVGSYVEALHARPAYLRSRADRE